jgi:nucleotide-binding universal stress UspA family protein
MSAVRGPDEVASGPILVGTDGSKSARVAVARGIELARALGAPLLILSAYEDDDGPAGRRIVDVTLAEAIKRAQKVGVPAQAIARPGDPADALIEVAEERSCSMIVVGNRGMTSRKRFLLGSVPDKVSHNARCSVHIVATDAAAADKP